MSGHIGQELKIRVGREGTGTDKERGGVDRLRGVVSGASQGGCHLAFPTGI